MNDTDSHTAVSQYDGARSKPAYWNSLVKQGGPIAAVIDPLDRRGFKNLYIDTLQKIVLTEVLDISGAVLLDFGCGSGRFFSLTVGLAKCVVGLEMSEHMLAYAREREQEGCCGLVVFDGNRLPFVENCFDAVLSVWTMQYLVDDRRFQSMAEQIVACVRAHGKIYLLEQVRVQEGTWQRTANEYHNVFKNRGCASVASYPVRNSRSLLLYAIRYGLVPTRWLSVLATHEIQNTRRQKPASWVQYQDHLFVFSKQ